MPLKVKLGVFKQLVRDIARERKKPEAEVLNKGLTTAIIGSNKYPGIVQLAPKATREQIAADLREGNLNIKLTVAALRNQGYFAVKRSRAEIQQKIAEVSMARLAKRQKSRAYIAAGFLMALRDLGILGKRGTKDVNLWHGGTAAQGYGVPATSGNLVAKAFSMSRGSEVILPPIMQQAVNNAVLDMRDYFKLKIGQLMRRLGA